jgi:hypothetical protein
MARSVRAVLHARTAVATPGGTDQMECDRPHSIWSAWANFSETPPREWRSRARFSETGSWTMSQPIWPTAGQRREAGPSPVRRDSCVSGLRQVVSVLPAV